MERKYRKLGKFVLNVERRDLYLNDLLAQKTDRHVQRNVHINFGEQQVEIYNQKKLVVAMKTVESKKWFHPLLKIEDFILLLVRMSLIQEKEIIISKGGLQAKEKDLIHQKNVRRFEKLYEKKTRQYDNDLERDLITLNLLLKYTTPFHLTTKNAGVILKTWYSFVTRVITRFIPEKIKMENLSNLSLSIDYGWTKFGNYDGTIKEIPKTQRYKMLGNAVTVKVVEEIIKRLKIK